MERWSRVSTLSIALMLTLLATAGADQFTNASKGAKMQQSTAALADEPCELILTLVRDDHYDTDSTYRLIVRLVEDRQEREVFNERIEGYVPQGRPYGGGHTGTFLNWYDLPIRMRIAKEGPAPTFRVSLVEAHGKDWVSIATARVSCPESGRSAKRDLPIEPPPYFHGNYTMILRGNLSPGLIQFSWQ